MKRTALIGIGDGRDQYHAAALRSAMANLPRFDEYVWVDDRDHRLGFAGAIQDAWSRVRTADYIFHLELDFTFTCRPDVRAMRAVLEADPSLAQVCLKRQPVNESERAAGGIVEANPDWFTDDWVAGHRIARHRVCFSTNPCLYRADLLAYGWPQVPQSEGVFTHQLLNDGFEFAYWGGKHDAPAVLHIGDVRAGGGY